MKCYLCRIRNARPGLRICARCCLEESDIDGDDAGTARMSPDAKSQLTIHWIHLYLNQKRAAAAAAAQRGC